MQAVAYGILDILAKVRRGSCAAGFWAVSNMNCFFDAMPVYITCVRQLKRLTAAGWVWLGRHDEPRSHLQEPCHLWVRRALAFTLDDTTSLGTRVLALQA